jgi:glutaredoxin
MAASITIYTTTQCAFCMMVKKYLEAKGQKYTTINLDEQPEFRDTVQKISGVQTVPVTVFEKDGRDPIVITGWNPNKLDEAINTV